MNGIMQRKNKIHQTLPEYLHAASKNKTYCQQWKYILEPLSTLPEIKQIAWKNLNQKKKGEGIE